MDYITKLFRASSSMTTKAQVYHQLDLIHSVNKLRIIMFMNFFSAREAQFRQRQGHFIIFTFNSLKLPSCQTSKTISDRNTKILLEQSVFFYGGVEVLIFSLSKNAELKKRHKTLLFHRSEPNVVLNEKLDPFLSDEIAETDISHPDLPI